MVFVGNVDLIEAYIRNGIFNHTIIKGGYATFFKKLSKKC